MPEEATHRARPRSGGDDRPAPAIEQRHTLLQKQAVMQRLECPAQMASRIQQRFVTVEQLVAAAASDRALTEYERIGQHTAAAIEAWWAHRFERERAVERSATQHTSWADTLATTRPAGGETA